MKAPNETEEGFTRKNELFALQTQRVLTAEELKELSALAKAAMSHLTFSRVKLA